MQIILPLLGISVLTTALLVFFNLQPSNDVGEVKRGCRRWIGLGIGVGVSLGTTIGMLSAFALQDPLAGLLLGPTMGTGGGMILGAGLDARYGRAGDVDTIESTGKAGVTILCAAGMVALLLYLLVAFSGLAPVR